jgi:hypothetical protein
MGCSGSVLAKREFVGAEWWISGPFEIKKCEIKFIALQFDVDIFSGFMDACKVKLQRSLLLIQ